MSGVAMEAAIQSVVQGKHRDPFAFLGPHGSTVRAWLPQAREAWVVLDGDAIRLPRLHEAGLYEISLERAPGAYRIRVSLPSGERQEFDDAYRFPPLLTPFELHLAGEGTNTEAYRTFGSHAATCEGVAGLRFAVWAPNAEVVSVVGDFNGWDRTRHPMRLRDGGVWEIFLPGLGQGTHYKYSILGVDGVEHMKFDPYGFYSELSPNTATVAWGLDNYAWGDAEWMAKRGSNNPLKSPLSVYEVHLSSWRRGEDGHWLGYQFLADQLAEYASKMGFTHVELLPVMEHPFVGSWGYQVSGYYAPTSRFGNPDGLRYLVDRLHRAGLGVILDWVPAHFPRDAHGLGRFDGTALYEHEDPRQGEHTDWGTYIFNYGRPEVVTFLLSNALYWLKEFHIDGLRVDAVASMLMLDYSRKAGEWIPNKYGGKENLDAIDFLKRFNTLVHAIPGAFTVAEESGDFAGVSRPVYVGGLGFTFKWNMGWMHDMFRYFKADPVFRKYHQESITFSLLYAFNENYFLSVSHDEVVHLKKSLLGKMPGDEWQRFANVRAFLGYMFSHPGKKLLFMGQEFGHPDEWNHDVSLPWHLLASEPNAKLQRYTEELNRVYRAEPALYEADSEHTGFEWIDFRDNEQSVIAFLRFASDPSDFLVVVCNFTPQPRVGYRVGVPFPGTYREILNSDAEIFGGSNMGNLGAVASEDIAYHWRPASLRLTLPPLSTIILKPADLSPAEEELSGLDGASAI